MILKRLFAIIFMATLTVSCRTAEGFYERMYVWPGQHVDKLVESWGPPRRSHQNADGTRVIEYPQNKNVTIPGVTTTTPQTSNHSGSVYAGGTSAFYSGTTTSMVTRTSPDMQLNLYCHVRFFIDTGGYIDEYEARGNDCLATPKPAPQKSKCFIAWSNTTFEASKVSCENQGGQWTSPGS